MKSRRFSLYLLGSPSPPSPSPASTSFDLEGEIYGIYWFKSDLQRIIKRGHSIKALKVDLAKFPAESLSSIPRKFIDSPPTLHLEIDFDALSLNSEQDEILASVWQVSIITSLDIKYCFLTGDFAKRINEWGPPAFAQTLRSIKSFDNLDFLNFLAPHCRNIREIAADGFYETIMANNPGLTALTVTPSGGTECYSSSIDLSQHTQLVKLSVHGSHKVFSRNPTSSVEDVALRDPDVRKALTFLIQCSSSLTHLMLDCECWQDMAQLINVLNPGKCKRLTLRMRSRVDLPSLDQVEEAILRKGFEIKNQDFFYLSVKGINDKCTWEKLIGIAPNILKMQVLHGDVAYSSPSFFSAFRDLTVIHLDSSLQWDQGTLSSLVKCCSVLRELTFSTREEFIGMVEIDSSSLKKLNLEFNIGYPSWKLRLCNLTHFSLTLPVGDDGFLVKFLNGNQFTFLPQLRVLSIFNTGSSNRTMAVVPCQAGHPSLTRLLLRGASSIGRITFRNLPNLREISIQRFPHSGSIVTVDVPGDCDISLSSNYTHQGGSARNFTAEIHHDADSNDWFERTITKSEIK